MEVLVLHNKLPYPTKDGGSIAVWNTVTEAANQGHKIYLLAINTSKHYFPPENLPKNLPNNLIIDTFFLNTDLTIFKLIKNFLFSRKSIHFKRFFSKEFANKLVKVVKENNFDVILFDGLYVLQYLDYVKKFSSALLVYRAHNIECEIWDRLAKNQPQLLKKYYLSNLTKRLEKDEKKYLEKTDLILTFTRRDEVELKKRFKITKDIFVSSIGINIKDDIEFNKIRFPSLFYIGSLDWIPNQEGLIWFLENIWPKVVMKFPNLEFEIAGRNPSSFIIKKVKKYKNVKFYGEIEDSHLFMIERAIMVVPLFSGSGIRIKIIEGLSLGKCIITTSIGVEGIPVTANEVIIADTTDQFIKKLFELLENKDLIYKYFCNSREFAKKYYNNKINVEKLFSFLESYKKSKNYV